MNEITKSMYQYEIIQCSLAEYSPGLVQCRRVIITYVLITSTSPKITNNCRYFSQFQRTNRLLNAEFILSVKFRISKPHNSKTRKSQISDNPIFNTQSQSLSQSQSQSLQTPSTQTSKTPTQLQFENRQTHRRSHPPHDFHQAISGRRVTAIDPGVRKTARFQFSHRAEGLFDAG